MGNTCPARGAQRQSQRKRIQRDTARGTEREGIEGYIPRDGVKEPEIEPEGRERAREEEGGKLVGIAGIQIIRSRSHRTELCEPSARAGLAFSGLASPSSRRVASRGKATRTLSLCLSSECGSSINSQFPRYRISSAHRLDNLTSLPSAINSCDLCGRRQGAILSPLANFIFNNSSEIPSANYLACFSPDC